MNQSERGFFSIESVVAVFLMVLLAVAANMTVFQTIKITRQSDSHITALLQVQNASYWISRDAQSAENVTTDNLSGTEFLVLSWTEVVSSDNTTDNTTDHTITYFFTGLSGGIGDLKRNHVSSRGINNETLVAEYIYYNASDPASSSNVSYVSPALTIKLTAIRDDNQETREYLVSSRLGL